MNMYRLHVMPSFCHFECLYCLSLGTAVIMISSTSTSPEYGANVLISFYVRHMNDSLMVVMFCLCECRCCCCWYSERGTAAAAAAAGSDAGEMR